jgi:hypothetical protein
LLQLAQGNGKKSSLPQYSSWQCLPMFSTSPFDILVYDFSVRGEISEVERPEDVEEMRKASLRVKSIAKTTENLQEAWRKRRRKASS